MSDTVTITTTVNGQERTATVEPRTLLVHLLREEFGLTGTHTGCETGQCGACTVHLDGRAVKSCMVLAVQADGQEVTTVEGVAPKGMLTPLQDSLWTNHGLQCGYCTPGIIMSALSLLKDQPDPSEEEIRHALEGNICRCTGYQSIVAAVKEAAGRMARGEEPQPINQ
jgi:carbon-monoxide dehydrogenase small subunit